MRDWTENQITIRLTFLRHGATVSNKEGRYLGKNEEPLSQEGIESLQCCKAAGKYPTADILLSGPMKRCLETAQILYPGQIPVLIPEWTEMDFGIFEGHNYKELSSEPRYQQWIDSGGMLPFPEGESREAFIRRCLDGYDTMLQNFRQRQQETDRADNGSGKAERILNVSAVVHGGTIMALLSHFAGGEYFDYQVKCGQGYTGKLVFTDHTESPAWEGWKAL